jgi:hypothetical protein
MNLILLTGEKKSTSFAADEQTVEAGGSLGILRQGQSDA